MGQKGDKHTNESQLSAELLLEKLAGIAGISSKKMFGGHGIFHEGKMFAMVDSKGDVYMRYDPAQFREIGESVKHGKMPYFTIPENRDVIGDLWERWARESIGM